MEVKVRKLKIDLIKGDITDQNTDVIVNAANSSLMGGGGVDGAIHRKGGPIILEECMKIRKTTLPNGLSVGKAVITKGGGLKAKHVIHTVGPVWKGKDDDEKCLSEAYLSSLKLAKENKLRTIAFPSISTGAYGYPIEKASRIALKTIKNFMEKEGGIEEVRFVLFSSFDLEIYQKALKEIL